MHSLNNITILIASLKQPDNLGSGFCPEISVSVRDEDITYETLITCHIQNCSLILTPDAYYKPILMFISVNASGCILADQ